MFYVKVKDKVLIKTRGGNKKMTWDKYLRFFFDPDQKELSLTPLQSMKYLF